jgi:RimJ/RimL family protein N-acetyltransferase
MIDIEGDDARTSAVSLRPIGEDDLPLITRHLADPDSMSPYQWFGWSDPHSWRRGWAENGLLGPDSGRLIVVEGGETVGFVAWRKIARGVSSCWNAGIVLWPEARGRGIGTRAQRMLARYLFAHSLAARVESDTDVDNIAEQRALEKAGFTREGVLRSYAFRDGAWRDAVIYSVLRTDLLPEAG